MNNINGCESIYDKMDNSITFEECLNYFDFSYKKKPDGYALIDLQGAYLGNIGNDRFYNGEEIITRLFTGRYGDDYILTDSIIKAYGCKDVDEFLSKYGNDKEVEDGMLYYCLHPEELSELPKPLDEKICKKTFNDAYIKAHQVADNALANLGFGAFVSDISPDKYIIKLVGFKNKDDMEKSDYGNDLRKIDKNNFNVISVNINMFMLNTEKNKTEEEIEEERE